MRRGRHYLRKICAVALCANPSIKFVAVLDGNGKLIVAECKPNTNNFGKHVANMNYLFHLHYIIPSLQERNNKNLKVTIDENCNRLDRIQNSLCYLEHRGCNNSISRNKRDVFMCLDFSRLSRSYSEKLNKPQLGSYIQAYVIRVIS